MSAKWRRSLAWDDQFFPAWAAPAKFVLRTFSSIWFAVLLLSLVAVYGALASIPIGLVALVPTLAFYGGVIGALFGAAVLVIAFPAWLALRRRGRAALFVAVFTGVMAALGVTAVAWQNYAWPRLHYDPATHAGVRFFADFIDAYKATTLRRLPGMEMSELEFYSWWPLRLVLLLFVVNLMVATLRRIEFTFKNLGVLTVHTGIVVIALGSVYYNGLKLEGDTILVAGPPAPDGSASDAGGPLQSAFYSNTRVALYVQQERQWGTDGMEQRVLRDVPRYNPYHLAAAGGNTATALTAGGRAPWNDAAVNVRTLDLPVPSGTTGRVDPDISFRIVGYAPYAEPVEDWVEVDAAGAAGLPPAQRNPLRVVYLHSALPHPDTGAVSDKPVFAFTMLPTRPQHRVAENGVMGVEYTLGPVGGANNKPGGMPDARWQALTVPLPPGTTHALVIEVPAAEGRAAFRATYPVEKGTAISVGTSGYRVRVDDLTPQPPFPIVTEGYRGANSAVATVQVTPPAGSEPAHAAGGQPYTRYVYHRYPELDQDILAGAKADGRPNRRDATDDIRIWYLDASRLQVYLDEQADGVVRAAVRQPGGQLRIEPTVGSELKDIVKAISLRPGPAWAHAERIDRPRPVPELEQEKQFVGTHDKAMLAVAVSTPGAALRVVWVPFSKYMGLGTEGHRRVTLPDGRAVTLAFGRAQHQFPNFALSLVNFEMIAYDHRGAPRDFQSVVRVIPTDGSFEPYVHVTKLNAPLMAPFQWTEDGSMIRNIAGRLGSGLNPGQFKLSQAGWDAGGWERTQRLVDQGLMKAPRATFTILGVGNNPGIHVIALGGILMALGIPWAFYVKPWLVKREKARVQAAVARGEFVPRRAPEMRTPESSLRVEPVSIGGEESR